MTTLLTPPTEIDVLAATRAHLEWYRTAMEQRGLAAATIDRRLCTVCGFYRFAHLDGRINSNPAQYVRRPKVQPSEGRGMDRSELAQFLFTAEHYDHTHAALAVLLGLNGPRVSEACSTDIADLAFEHGHRTRHATPTGTVFGERPLRFNSTIQSSKRSSTVARDPVWRPLPTSVSSSARAFFASRRLPWNARLTCRRLPVTTSRPASTTSSHTPGARSRIPGADRSLAMPKPWPTCGMNVGNVCWIFSS